MKYVYAIAVFVCGEIIAFIIFSILKNRLGPKKDSPASRGDTAKGMLERLTIFTGLIHGFPQILIAFGALKLGTRLYEEKDSNISNTYFLVGNLVSIFLAMAYAAITNGLWQS